jgi:hypothetical protein
MNESKLVKASDGIVWAPLQPIYLEIEEKLLLEDVPESVQEQLRTVLTFLSCLIIEGELQEAQQ